jgi:hypothetical protein
MKTEDLVIGALLLWVLISATKTRRSTSTPGGPKLPTATPTKSQSITGCYHAVV